MASDPDPDGEGLIVKLRCRAESPVRVRVDEADLDDAFKSLAMLRVHAPDGADDSDENAELRWRYRVVKATFGDGFEDRLNEYGVLGWEIVSITAMDSTLTLTGNKLFAVLKQQYRAEVRPPRAPSRYRSGRQRGN